MKICFASTDDVPACVELDRQLHQLTRFARYQFKPERMASQLCALIETGQNKQRSHCMLLSFQRWADKRGAFEINLGVSSGLQIEKNRPPDASTRLCTHRWSLRQVFSVKKEKLMTASQDQSGKKIASRNITRQDMEILENYVSRNQAQRYWAYLATIGETYARLAPGVVLTADEAASHGRQFYWTQYRNTLRSLHVKQRMQSYGAALMQADFQERAGFLKHDDRKSALHLPAARIYAQHKRVLSVNEYWTPASILKPFFDGPYINHRVGQSIWEEFLQLIDIYQAQSTSVEIFSAVALFKSRLYWLEKVDSRALDDRLNNWLEFDIMPALMAVAIDAHRLLETERTTTNNRTENPDKKTGNNMPE